MPQPVEIAQLIFGSVSECRTSGCVRLFDSEPGQDLGQRQHAWRSDWTNARSCWRPGLDRCLVDLDYRRQAPAGTIHVTSAAGNGEVPVDPRNTSALTVSNFGAVDVRGKSKLDVSNPSGLGPGGSVYPLGGANP
jgi:hypothetical protein